MFFLLLNFFAFLFIVSSFLLPPSFFIWPESHKSIASGVGVFLFLIQVVNKKKIFFDKDLLFLIIFFLFLSFVSLKLNIGNLYSYTIAAIAYALLAFLSNIVALNFNKEKGVFIIVAVCASASFFSFIIQLIQFFDIDTGVPYLILNYDFSHGRPYANFGQPNILGSFYLFTLTVIFFASSRKIIKMDFLVFYFFLMSYAIFLTQSRTAYLSLAILSIIYLFEKNISFYRKLVFPVTLLLVLLFDFSNSISSEGIRLISGDISSGRFGIYRESFEIIKGLSFFGYGVNETGRAFFQSNFMGDVPRYTLVAQAHNIFIDFIIWFGIIPGGFLCFCFVKYFLLKIKSLENEGKLFFLACITPFLVHSNLEFPLYYASNIVVFFFLIGVFSRGESMVVNCYLRWSFIFIILIILVFFARALVVLELDMRNQSLYFSRVYGVEKTEIKKKMHLFDIPSDVIYIKGYRSEHTTSSLMKMEVLLNYFVIPSNYWILAEYYIRNDDKENFENLCRKGKYFLSRDNSVEFENFCNEKSN